MGGGGVGAGLLLFVCFRIRPVWIDLFRIGCVFFVGVRVCVCVFLLLLLLIMLLFIYLFFNVYAYLTIEERS